MKIDIYQDGSCNNHQEDPYGGIGVAVFIDDNYEEELSRAILVQPKGIDNRNTNNVIEWEACVEAMRIYKELFKEYPNATFNVFSDSQVITQVFNGRHKTHTPSFIEYNKSAHEFVDKIATVKINWVPREQNKYADKLSKDAYKQKKITDL